jgi:hypothetical protein
MKSLSNFTEKKIADFAGMIHLIRMMRDFYFGKRVKVDKIWKQEPGYFSYKMRISSLTH